MNKRLSIVKTGFLTFSLNPICILIFIREMMPKRRVGWSDLPSELMPLIVRHLSLLQRRKFILNRTMLHLHKSDVSQFLLKHRWNAIDKLFAAKEPAVSAKLVMDLMQPMLLYRLINSYARNEEWAKVRFMLNNGADPSLLAYSMRRAKLKNWQRQLEKLTELGISALVPEFGFEELKRMLLNIQPKFPVEKDLESMMRWEIDEGKSAACVKLLISYGMDMYYGAHLHPAVCNGDHTVMEFLLEAGAVVTHSNPCIMTALHLAAIYGHAEIVELLLEAGADKDAKEYADYTPLHLAVSRGHESTTRILLDAGADVNANRSRGKESPLHLAVLNRHEKITKMLLEAGADVNAKVYSEKTPLHFAAILGSLSLVKILHNAGADWNARDRFGRTPLHIAVESREHNLVKLFEELTGC